MACIWPRMCLCQQQSLRDDVENRDKDGGRIVLYLIGQIGSEHIDGLKWQISRYESRVLVMQEVMLVDAEVARFLGDCEAEGIEVLHCSRYIREYVSNHASSSSE